MFSGAVKLEDINDFINPSQECIVPILNSTTVKGKEDRQNDQNSLSNEVVRPNLIKTRPRRTKRNGTTVPAQPSDVTIVPSINCEVLPSSETITQRTPPIQTQTPAAEVSLYDCLACSGCVTTAEAILLQDQSVDVFINRARNSRFTVVSLSSQSIDYIATHFSLPARECFRKLAWIFKSYLNVNVVIDTSVADALVLTETLREFLERYANTQPFGEEERVTVKSPSLVKNSDLSQTADEIVGTSLRHRTISGDCNPLSSSRSESSYVSNSNNNHPLPLLTSHCPGWICYAEKTQPASIVSVVSRLKSAQQILGHLVKTLMVDAYNLKKFAYSYRQSTVLPVYIQLLRFKKWAKMKNRNCTTNPTTDSQSYSLGDSCSVAPSVEFDSSCIDQQYLQSSDVFHAAVMPCYDKKLETVRPENCVTEEKTFVKIGEPQDAMAIGGLVNNQSSSGKTDNKVPPNNRSSNNRGIQEVDTVLATVEIFHLLERLGISSLKNVESIDPSYCDDLFLGTSNWSIWQNLPRIATKSLQSMFHGSTSSMSRCNGETTQEIRRNSTGMKNGSINYDFSHPSSYCLCCHTTRLVKGNDASGGFLEYCFRESAKILFNIKIPPDEPLKMRSLANRDMKEISLKIGEELKLRFVLAYGFRNIQNIVKHVGPSSFVSQDVRKKTQLHRNETPGEIPQKQEEGEKRQIKDYENENIVFLNRTTQRDVTENRTQQPFSDKALLDQIENSFPTQNGPFPPPSSSILKPIDFVEIMACPRGCRYGGGQIIPGASKTSKSSLESNKINPSHPDEKPQSLSNKVESSPFSPSSLDKIVHSDSILISAHHYPSLELIYRYLIYLEVLRNPYQPPASLQLTWGQYKCLTDTREQSNGIALSALRW